MEKNKFYNFVSLTRVEGKNGDVIVATLEGSTTMKAIESKMVPVSGEDRKVSKFSLRVDGNLQSRFDFTSKLDRAERDAKVYKDFDYVTVVGWGDVADRLEKSYEPHRKMLLTGILSQKSFKGKEGEFAYLELSVQDKFNFKGIGAKTTDGNVEQNTGKNPEDTNFTPEDDGDIPF